MEILLAAAPSLPPSVLLGGRGGGQRELSVMLLPLGRVGLQSHVRGVRLQGERGGVVGVGDVLVVVVAAVHVEGQVPAGDIQGVGVVVVGVLLVDTVAPALLAGPAEVVAAVEELVALVERGDFNVDMSRPGVTETGGLNHWSHCLRIVYHGSNSNSNNNNVSLSSGEEQERVR